jgi:hypothetical protein
LGRPNGKTPCPEFAELGRDESVFPATNVREPVVNATLAHIALHGGPCYKLTVQRMEGATLSLIRGIAGSEGMIAFDGENAIANAKRFIQTFESKGNTLGYDAKFVFRRTSAPFHLPLK